MTKTVTYQSFEMEMTAETTVEEIQQAVEYAQQYEFDREDITHEEVEAKIEAAVRGLVWARNNAFDLSDNNPYEQGGTDAHMRAKARGEILE